MIFTFPCSGCHEDNKGANCNEECISWWVYLVNIEIPPLSTEELFNERYPGYDVKDFSP